MVPRVGKDCPTALWNSFLPYLSRRTVLGRAKSSFDFTAREFQSCDPGFMQFRLLGDLNLVTLSSPLVLFNM